jgi:hypothetical protein
MLVQAWHVIEKRIDECLAEPSCGPILECFEIEHMLDDRVMRINVGANVNVAFNDFHRLDSVVFLIRETLAWSQYRSGRPISVYAVLHQSG